MGKNNGNSWLNAVKKAFKSPSNDHEKRTNKRKEENNEQEEDKKRGKRRWIFGKHLPTETTIQHKVAKTAIRLCTDANGYENMVEKQPKMESIPCLSEQKLAIEVAMATTAAAEAAVVNAVEIIRLTRTSHVVRQHEAAVVIQTIFRGYLARRALLALNGVVKMQALIRGHNVRRRAKTTLQCIQSLVRVQALVCDQRRRLSCDATMFGQTNTSRKSILFRSNITNNLEVEEIQTLIQKAKQCSLKQGNTLAHILSQQTCEELDEDQTSHHNYREIEKHERICRAMKSTVHPTVRKDRNLCSPRRDPIKTVEIDTIVRSQNQDSYFAPSVHSPKTPSTLKSFYSHRTSLSENSCPLPRPSYMAATQSAIARVRSNSTPRQRPSSPNRQQVTSTARKRLSFPTIIPHDGHNVDGDDDDKISLRRCRGNRANRFGDEGRANAPCYLTE